MQNNKILTEVINKVAKDNNINSNIVEGVLLSIFKTVKIAIGNKANVKIPYIAKFVTSESRIAWIDGLKNKTYNNLHKDETTE